MHKIEVAFKKFLEENNNIDYYYIAYSGGVDSQVLLYLCHKFIPDNISAYHINHGISENADFWQDFCYSHADSLNVPFQMAKFDLKHMESGLEEAARKLRYSKFSEVINSPSKALLTGHHLDDQAETFLLHLMRGAGVDGLSGISQKRDFSNGFLLRPLLEFSKEEIIEYAIDNSLEWIEDESNSDSKYDRNFIRNEVMPLLKSRWNKANSMIAVAADNCKKASDDLNAKYEKLFLDCYNKKENSLNINFLKNLNREEQIQVIRQWFKKNEFQTPERKLIYSILDNIVFSNSKNGFIDKKQFSIRRYKDKIYFVLDDISYLYEFEFIEEQNSEGLLNINTFSVYVKSREGGETIKINGQTKKAKTLLQTLDIPTWEKDRLPFIYYGETLVSIGGYFNHQDFLSNKGYKIKLKKA